MTIPHDLPHRAASRAYSWTIQIRSRNRFVSSTREARIYVEDLCEAWLTLKTQHNDLRSLMAAWLENHLVLIVFECEFSPREIECVEMCNQYQDLSGRLSG